MNNREKVGRALAIALAVGLTLPIIFGKAREVKDTVPGDPWRDTIYDFQTLITGAFAVAAAYLTIQQMRRTDEAAERRHEQFRRLELRTDSLRIERMLYPQLSQLKAVHSRLHYLVTHDVFRKEDEFKRGLKLTAACCIRIAEVMLRPDWLEAKGLWGGFLAGKIASVDMIARELGERVEWASIDEIADPPSHEAMIKKIRHSRIRLPYLLENAEKEVGELCGLLERLGQTYDVHL